MNTTTITLRLTTSKPLPDNFGERILNRISTMQAMEGAQMEVVQGEQEIAGELLESLNLMLLHFPTKEEEK